MIYDETFADLKTKTDHQDTYRVQIRAVHVLTPLETLVKFLSFRIAFLMARYVKISQPIMSLVTHSMQLYTTSHHHQQI